MNIDEAQIEGHDERKTCRIAPMQPAHCRAVARLHLQHLTTPFMGKPGLELLSLYYKEVSKGQGGCGYVAVLDGEVVGYICGIWDRQTLRRNLLRRAWFWALFWSFAQELTKPKLFINFIQRLNQTMRNRVGDFEGYELRPIVVSPKARGNGVAGRLLEAIYKDANERGYETIQLFAEPENARANSFYQKNRFHFMGHKASSDGFYNYYERSTSEHILNPENFNE